jgi:hypothetical protein
MENSKNIGKEEIAKKPVNSTLTVYNDWPKIK